MTAPDPELGKHAGQVVRVTGLGPVRLLRALAQNPETALYLTDQDGVVVKVFDLSCGRPDEVGYGPYMNFRSEQATFEELQHLETLRLFVPTYFGGDLDYERQYAFIAMERLRGHNLRYWGEELAAGGYDAAALDELRRALQEVLAIVDLFHRHGLVLMDFKPDNVIRLEDGAIRLVDLGAFFTPRHRHAPGEFLYAATPDHAEVVIDVSNLQAGVPPGPASDIFSAGVALFEMATGTSRLVIDAATAREMLATPALYRFRDSQITDVWKAFPHLKEALPLVQTQLREGRLLFAEFWHLLKAYLAARVPEWENLDADQQAQLLLGSGTTFIQEQLPAPLTWLAGPIARATVLRSLRISRVGDLAQLLGNPAPEHVRADVISHNCLLRHLEALGLPTDFAGRLNTWDVRLDRRTGHWAIAAPAACWELADNAPYVYLRRSHNDEQGHTYWHAVDEFEADPTPAGRANLAQLRHDHRAWLGAAPMP